MKHMTNTEKEILEQIASNPAGLLYPSRLPTVAKENQNEFHKLISGGFIEEVNTIVPSGKPIIAYRATNRGCAVSAPLHKKIWYFIASDIRTIVVSAVISIVTTIITVFVSRLLK